MIKRVIVTGDKGYIGTNLVRHLGANGFIVGGIDKKDGLYCEEIKLPKKHNLGGIIHLAALSSVGDCQDDPNQAIKDNILATSNIFHQAYEARLPIISISSQAAKTPGSSIYAFTKFYMEYMAEIYRSLGADVRVLRPSNVYGGIDYLATKGSVIAKFIQAKKKKEPLTIHGKGKQTRDFIHVNDVCDAILASLYLDPEAWDGPIDIGYGRSMTINDLADLVDNERVFDESAFVGVLDNRVNIKQAETLLGFSPKFTVDDYVRSVLG